MSISIISVFFIALLTRDILATSAGYGHDTAPTATIDSGSVVGQTTSIPGGKIPINKYLGVPFAAPPVRFEPPMRPTPWSEPFDASEYGPACIQQFPYQPSPSRDQVIAWFNTPPPPAGESEDCLNVNIYAPATPGKKPVMFWIYGGSLQFGANSLPNYDGSSIAANQDVVVVTVNYRTNVFGFPGSPLLPNAAENLGQHRWLDQHFALDWVQRNIHAFGGDPKQVVIFGESAGAASVDALVTSYTHDPPFSGAIMESGQATFFATNANATAPWNTMVLALNCSAASDVLACVRAVSATTIKSVIEHGNIVFRPVKDNITYVAHPWAARKQGNIAPVPILIGNNANEGRIFTVGFNTTQEYLAAFLPNMPQSFYDAVLAEYPIGSPGISNEFEQESAIDTDYRFQCAASNVANASIQAGFPTWRYFFNASFANTQFFSDAGVYHSSEIQEIFGTYPRGGVTTKQETLSAYMQKAWAAFANHPKAGPGWVQIPNIGVLGSPGHGLEYNIPESTLDRRCHLYQSIYEALYS
ncbi:alpha/beta-hydrolase [Rhizodiscina lignyota]|uniref:Carboxylic ester hydrolase n=1 Tax=Rhizodiscina lignyota TaxID=1504668 RepID=A0A9P4I589_9PEZI|nr:alpha/beta-hydrolase [Rhizodiscina lignyota]